MSRKYYTLVERSPGGPWAPQFGDYSKAVVMEERRDMMHGSSRIRHIDLKIIESGDTQEEINAAVALLNKESEVVRKDNVEYHAGRDSYEDGLPLSANPHLFREGDSPYARWELGWNDASMPPKTADIAVIKTIDLTPTWEGLVPTLLALHEQGSAEGRKTAREELTRLAKFADQEIAKAKAATNPCIVITYNREQPEDTEAYKPHGPFPTHEAACEWAEETLGLAHWFWQPLEKVG